MVLFTTFFIRGILFIDIHFIIYLLNYISFSAIFSENNIILSVIGEHFNDNINFRLNF